MVASSQLGDSEAPLLSSDALRAIPGPRFFVRTVPRIDTDPSLLLAVPVNSSGHHLFLIAGATLGDRNDALHQLFVALAIGGPLALIAIRSEEHTSELQSRENLV